MSAQVSSAGGSERLPVPQTAAPLFCPDGKWLLVRTKGYEFWDISSWTVTHRIPRETDVPGGAAFSRDGPCLNSTHAIN